MSVHRVVPQVIHAENGNQPVHNAPEQSRLTKIRQAVCNFFCPKSEYLKLGKGADKIVWVRVDRSKLNNPENNKEFAQHAYYTPNRALLFSREKSLRKEFETVERIKGDIKEPQAKEYLAIDWERKRGADKIKGQFTLQVGRADGDLEKEIVDREVKLPERINYLRHLFTGLSALHQADFLHLDLKPENCLIFKKAANVAENEEPREEKIVKIADYGRSKKITDAKKSFDYKGNTRFAAPDPTYGKKSEVFSMCLIAIRVLEETVIQPEYVDGKPIYKSLIEVAPEDRDSKPHESRHGLERYILEHKSFIACENKGTSVGRLKNALRRNNMAGDYANKAVEQQEALRAYIDALCDNLPIDDNIQKEGLKTLLRSMVSANPDDRTDISFVLQRFNGIFGPGIR